MCNRARQFDMTHTVATNFRQRYLYATFFTDYAAMLKSLVFATEAFVVFGWAENFGAEQTIALRLECPIVYSFRLFHFAERPRSDHLRRGKTDANGVKFIGW